MKLKIFNIKSVILCARQVLRQIFYTFQFVLLYGDMQNNDILQINEIFKKNCFRTFVHTPLSGRRTERTFVLDRAVHKGFNLCALSTQPVGPFFISFAVQDCNKN